MNESTNNNLPSEPKQKNNKKKENSNDNFFSRFHKDKITKFVKSSKTFIQDKVSVNKIPQLFQVSEQQIAEILETVREKLPTTEAILIGKTQSGKSSIVRGITGFSPDIVGQGFRPHTKHTNQYTYPNQDLPLLIFTDTVGLGDVQQNSDAIIEELSNNLQQETQRARILILTVKINDFATETLAQIARKLRELFPKIPCLLVITCLHEIYPSSTEEHPIYPPEFEDINRAFTHLKQAFKGLYHDSILIDFTLEEDGYTPVFYGLETLRDTIAQQLPEAESLAIYQLLEGETSEKIGNL